jgi:hypothetical protein
MQLFVGRREYVAVQYVVQTRVAVARRTATGPQEMPLTARTAENLCPARPVGHHPARNTTTARTLLFFCESLHYSTYGTRTRTMVQSPTRAAAAPAPATWCCFAVTVSDEVWHVWHCTAIQFRRWDWPGQGTSTAAASAVVTPVRSTQ